MLIEDRHTSVKIKESEEDNANKNGAISGN